MKKASATPKEKMLREMQETVAKASFKISEPVAWFDSRYYEVLLDKKVFMLPSVTTKLGAVSKGDFLERYRGEIGNREADSRLEEAGDRGSRIHHAIFTVLMNNGAAVFTPPWNKARMIDAETMEKLKETFGENIAYLPAQEEVVAVWRFREWMKKVSPLIIGGEMKVFSLKHRFAGALDWAFHISAGVYNFGGRSNGFVIEEDGIYVIDIKSGAEGDGHRMQVAAYAAAFEEDYKTPVAGGIIVYLNGKKAGGLETVSNRFIGKDGLKKEFDDFLHASALWDRKHTNDTPNIFTFPPVIVQDETQLPKTK
jgi:hypothetical protein